MEQRENRKERKITTIKIERETKTRLDKLKEHEKESYNEVVKKLLHLLNIFRKNPEQGRKFFGYIDRTIKRRKVYQRIPQIKQMKTREEIKKEVRQEIDKEENRGNKSTRQGR
tara:strand:+ start:70 stop:408 length:339 start_codon:yes stop_codon:yes gene_type:complete